LRRWLPAASASSEGVTPGPRLPTRGDIPGLEGIDVAGSLERLGLELESFQRMLIRFADGKSATFDPLRAALVAGDSDGVAKHATGSRTVTTPRLSCRR